MSGRSRILLCVKAPARGAVKSRIAAELGEDAALDLYRAFAADVLAATDRTGIDCTLCVHPPDAVTAVSAWLGPERHYLPQQGADLGERMENAFRAAFAAGADRAILIGSDLPDLPPDLLVQALGELERCDAVIGPAADGGYYLIGFRCETFRPQVFGNIAWSTASVFAGTMRALTTSGSLVRVLRQWQDVDTADDLRALAARSAGTAFEGSRTMQTARSLLRSENN